MKQIILHTGNFALVDDEDFDFINQWKWYERKGKHTSYACKMFYSRHLKKEVSVCMHRLILGISGRKTVVDHINKNGLDNRRINIRAASYSENCGNRTSKKNSSSKHLGVCKTGNKWMAQIVHNGKQIYLGIFKNEEDAALAYNSKAIELRGEFASINKI